MNMDWQAYIYQSGKLEQLMGLAKRRFGDSVLAEESFNYAFERISRENWKVLTEYRGRSKPGSYLNAVFNNLIEDFARSRFGRPRPPTWLQRLGNLWKRVYQLLCLERKDPEEIVFSLSTSGGRDPARVWEAIDGIRAKIPKCGETQREISEDFSNGSGTGAHYGRDYPYGEDPEKKIYRETLATLLQALAVCLNKQPAGENDRSGSAPHGGSQPVEGKLQDLPRSFSLSDEERLILMMVYQDGFKVPKVAKELHVPEHKVRRTLQAAIQRIRDAFEKAGVTDEVIRELLSA